MSLINKNNVHNVSFCTSFEQKVDRMKQKTSDFTTKRKITDRNIFLSNINSMVKETHPKKQQYDKDVLQYFSEYIKCVCTEIFGGGGGTTIPMNLQNREHIFIEKISKVREYLKTEDTSKHINYKEQIKKIIEKEYNLSLNTKILVVSEIELLLSQCEFEFIDENKELEKNFIKKLTFILNKYNLRISNNILFQITSIGKEINKHNKNLIQNAINKEFRYRSEFTDFSYSKKGRNIDLFDRVLIKQSIMENIHSIIYNFEQKTGIIFDESSKKYLLGFLNMGLYKGWENSEIDKRVDNIAKKCGIDKINNKLQYEEIYHLIYNLNSVTNRRKGIGIEFKKSDIFYLFS
ncbi:hypothetical protein AB837_00424 [bacterium AB1]|nr:hypothetical protein AB837_00424 [bacterium AB1]